MKPEKFILDATVGLEQQESLSTSHNFYRLIQGDCYPVLSKMDAESVNLIIADPPYNIGKAEWEE